MIFYILISIVFIAEIVIACALISVFVKLDKKIRLWNEILDEIKPKIKDITEIAKKISEQMLEFAPIVAEKVKSILYKIVADQFKSMLAGFTFWLVKKEVEKKFVFD